MPSEVQYSLDELTSFIEKDRNPSIAFYGGEPLLRIDLIKEIMNRIEAEHYILQTNGLLLNKLPKEYARRFSSILVSLDGIKEVTDYHRGRVYDRVMENVKLLQKYYRNELVARMVATEKTDIFRDVRHLLNLGFTHVHWQINAVWVPEDFWSDFPGWMRNYNLGISRLVNLWLESMQKGKVLGIVPFLGITTAILNGKSLQPPCGSGKNSFAITTDGRVLACPICGDMDWNNLGDIWNGFKSNLSLLDPCNSCDVLDLCGGRCLFFNRERLWSENKFNIVCSATKHLIMEIKRILPEIQNLIEGEVINLKDIIYPKFNNTTEIVP